MKKPIIYHSKVLKRFMEEMDAEPWYVRLKRRIKVEFWILYCLYIRKYFDK